MSDGMEVYAQPEKDRDNMMASSEPTASANCPVCGKDFPHGHTQSDMVTKIADLTRQLAEVTAERDAARLRSENAEGMAECMDMLRRDLIAAGLIESSVPPMFMTEAILGAIQKAQARAKWLEVENANNLDLLRAERDLVASIWEASGAENGRSLVEQIAAMRADAGRYRWLRNESDCPISVVDGDGDMLVGDDLDAAIDAAKEAK